MTTLRDPSRYLGLRHMRRSSSFDEDVDMLRKKQSKLNDSIMVQVLNMEGEIEGNHLSGSVVVAETAPVQDGFQDDHHSHGHHHRQHDQRQFAQSQPAQSQPGIRVVPLSNSAGDLLQQKWANQYGSSEVLTIPECSICYQEYSESNEQTIPRNLSCGHTYCTGCLQKLLCKSDRFTSKIVCPNICHVVTHVRDYSISNIPKNYALLRIMRDMTTPRRISRREEPDVVTKQVPKCPEHDDFLRSYCLKDGELICSSCELYGSHKGHTTLFVSEAAQEEKKNLEKFKPEISQQKERMEEALYRVEDICHDTQKAGGKMEDEVDQFFDMLIAQIDEIRKQVKTNVHMRTQLRVKALMGQAKDLRECAERASAVHRKTKGLIHAGDYDVLRDARLTLEQIEGIFVNPPPTAPKARNDLKCSFLEDMRDEVCSSLGRVASITPEILTIDSSHISVEAFYDGFRISWEKQNFVDNLAISYHLQMAKGDADYVNIYRGSSSKYTLKTDLERGVSYKFRVQVRTTEGVGVWSDPQVSTRAEPSMHWHKKWRSVKVELSSDDLEASWLGGSNSHWATFAADKLFEGSGQYYAEIEILSLGKNRPREKLVIGVISCNSKAKAHTLEWHNRKNPVGEWDTPSWGFLPILGLLRGYMVPSKGVEYGKDLMIQVSDRIGVLVDVGQKKLNFFCNGSDLGVASDDLEGQAFLLAVSIRDKIKIRLRFPPPPYTKRTIKLIQLQSSLLA